MLGRTERECVFSTLDWSINVLKEDSPIAVAAADTPPRTIRSIYPEPFASMMDGRENTP